MSIHFKKPIRSFEGEIAITNKTNKKYLKKDFNNCCGYCGDHNKYSGGDRNFHVEHFAPKSRFPELATIYENLIYSCPYCNLSKSDKWLGTTASQTIVSGRGFIDPCDDQYEKCLYRKDNGELDYYAHSITGQYIYTELKLFLVRHKYCYQMEKLLILAKEIKENIDSGKLSKKELLIQSEIYKELAVFFLDQAISFDSEYD